MILPTTQIIAGIFSNINTITKKEAKNDSTSPLLISFKKKYKYYKSSSSSDKSKTLEWSPLANYQQQFLKFYKLYYGIIVIKKSDSTLKELLKELTLGTTFYTLSFTDDSADYDIVVKNILD